MQAWLLYPLWALLTLFLLIVLLAFLFQDQLIFHPQPLDPIHRQQFRHLEVAFEHRGETLRGWYLPPATADAPLLVYYGGNGEEISWNLPPLGQLGAGLLLVNYRGYGDSSGSPSATALKADALHILDTLTAQEGIPLGRVVLMGRSLGSGVATYVASRRPVAGTVLVTPYDSLAAVADSHYPWLPNRLLLRHRFESDRLAPAIHSPLLNLIAGRDRVVPPQHAVALGEVWGGRETRVRFEAADHINITDQPGYWPAIQTFIRQLPAAD